MLIPERFALAMQADGWLLRDVIIWHKLSPMPSSVSGWEWSRHRVKVKGKLREGPNPDRNDGGMSDVGGSAGPSCEWIDCPGCPKCEANDGLVLSRGSWRTTSAHEYIFMFAKSMGYFCDQHAVKEPAESATVERNNYSRVNDDRDEAFAVKHDHEFVGLTRNPRSVRNFKASFYNGKHYAAFPISIPEWCIRAGTSSKGVCAECGAPWARITERESQGAWNTHEHDEQRGQVGMESTRDRGSYPQPKSIGWRATCDCNASAIPATVLDCFGGTGTSAEAAISLGRRAVLCELNDEYVKQIHERIEGSVPLLSQALGLPVEREHVEVGVKEGTVVKNDAGLFGASGGES